MQSMVIFYPFGYISIGNKALENSFNISKETLRHRLQGYPLAIFIGAINQCTTIHYIQSTHLAPMNSNNTPPYTGWMLYIHVIRLPSQHNLCVISHIKKYDAVVAICRFMV